MLKYKKINKQYKISNRLKKTLRAFVISIIICVIIKNIKEGKISINELINAYTNSQMDRFRVNPMISNISNISSSNNNDRYIPYFLRD